MANVANCKKCGILFLQTSKRDICDKCFEEQNKMISEINKFVLMAEEPEVALETIFEKFPITRNEFEEFFVAGKFVRVATKITMICSKCGNKVPIANKTGTLCAICTKKIQNEI